MIHTNELASVAVVIPAYNAARFIHQTIQSVLRQTHLLDTIIVVDGGSTDNTVEIVHSFASHLLEVSSVVNGGVSRARNIGFMAANADYNPSMAAKMGGNAKQRAEDVFTADKQAQSYCKLYQRLVAQQ